MHLERQDLFPFFGIRDKRMKNSTGNKKELSPKQREEFFDTLKARFEKNRNRHQDLEWTNVRAKLEASAEMRHALRYKAPRQSS